MADLSPGAITRKARTKGGVVTIVTVLAMVTAMGLTWFGLSAGDHVSAGYDSSSWLWSLTRGELARVNGVTGKVDTRSQALAASQGHYMQVSQSDRFLILRDQNTGRISALDPATLQVTAAQDSQAGLGVQVALHNDTAFIVDPVQGVVRQLDAATLQPIGEPLRYPPGITGGYFDGTGRLWIAVPSQGTVSAITPAKPAAASGGTGGGNGPSLVRTEPVAEAFHDLALSALDDGVAVLDQTNGTLTTLRGKELKKVDVTQAAGGELPTRSSGAEIPITVTEGRTCTSSTARRSASSPCPAAVRGCARRWPGRAGSTSPTTTAARCTRWTVRARWSTRSSSGARVGRWSWRCGRTTCSSTRRARRPRGWSTTSTGSRWWTSSPRT
ncbi:hypothetical protein [Catellatospora bangladeshensis]